MAMDDAYYVDEDVTLSVTDLEDRVLYNDEDVDADALIAGYDAATNDGPDHGTVTMAPCRPPSPTSRTPTTGPTRSRTPCLTARRRTPRP